jgi:hypothetical protein
MRASTQCPNRLSQGDILRDVEHVEYVHEVEGILEVSRIVFPFAVVLTQDCDLAQDPRCQRVEASAERGEVQPPRSQSAPDDKWLLSVLLAPMYNALHLFEGTHLSDLGLQMQRFSSDPKRKIKINEVSRYHYLEFTTDIPMPAVVVDFKHYFSANAEYLKQISGEKFICQIPALFREDVSDRFAAYLSRIALPIEDEKTTAEPQTLAAAPGLQTR